MNKLLLLGALVMSSSIFGQTNLRFKVTRAEGENFTIVEYRVTEDAPWKSIDTQLGFGSYIDVESLPDYGGEELEAIQCTYLDDVCYYRFVSYMGEEISVDKSCGDAQFQEEWTWETLAEEMTGFEYGEGQGDEVAVPENNFSAIQAGLVLVEKDFDAVGQWIMNLIKEDSENPFTQQCSEFIDDATDLYWGYDGSIEETDFNNKWEDIYDIHYVDFGHAFENGNGGWASKRISAINYLGEYNDGDWFEITIGGGVEPDNYLSQTLIRVVKIINEGDGFKIDNFLSLQDE
ncbi:MAG: hypothetical protein ACI837_000301 [Crocinitomicaceae bacterium]|jgi:hypothetical protein